MLESKTMPLNNPEGRDPASLLAAVTFRARRRPPRQGFVHLHTDGIAVASQNAGFTPLGQDRQALRPTAITLRTTETDSNADRQQAQAVNDTNSPTRRNRFGRRNIDHYEIDQVETAAAGTPPIVPPGDEKRTGGTEEPDDNNDNDTHGTGTPGKNEVEIHDKESEKKNRGKVSRFFSPTGTAKGDLREVRKSFQVVGTVYADLFRELRSSFRESLHPPQTPPIITGRIAAILSRGDPASASEGSIVGNPPPSTTQPDERSQEVALFTPEPARRNPTKLFAYPYSRRPDWRDTHHPVILPTDIVQTISQITDPIVEVGGATRDGYRLLGNQQLFSTEPVITDANFYDNDSVECLDARDMPFFNNSIGMFLISHTGDTDYPSFEALERRKALFGVWTQQEQWHEVAREEMESLIKDPRGIPQFNLHAKILREIARTLAPNGLLLWQNMSDRGMAYAQRLGLEPILMEPEWHDGEHNGVILRKIPQDE
jgi:hypothetical protein